MDIMDEMKAIVHLTKKDFELTFYRGSGNGGQNRNKVSSCCRIRHPASGCVATCEEERDQMQNRKIAFMRLVEQPKFKLWLTKEHNIRMGKILSDEAIEKKVDEMMDIGNIKIEVKEEGKWKEVDIAKYIFD